MPSYELAPQVDTYIANPGNPPARLAPCSDPEVTPQKVCGTLTAPAAGETEVLEWDEFEVVTGAGGAVVPLAGTTILARRATVSAAAGNTVDCGVGPTTGADLFTIPAGVSGYEIPMPDGTSFDLSKWYAKSPPTIGQILKVAYLPG